MARQRRTAANLWDTDRENQLDDMFSVMRTKAADKLGRNDISIGTEAEALIVGLPLPALCLRYLYQSTVLPLSRIHHLTGEEGSCKSSYMYEMMRWHMVYGGGVAFMENENKDSPTLRHSILQWNERWIRRIEKIPTRSLEEWQSALTHFLTIAKEQQDADGGPGRTVPIMFALDSLMSTGPEEEIKKILETGHASRNFALAALLISQYMKTMPNQIRDYPFSVVSTNHLKPSTDFQGRPTANIPGGKSVKFMETYEIEMKKAPSPDIDLVDYGGLRVKFTSRKNSLGPSRKQIIAELLWWNDVDPTDGMMKQQTAWDWDSASISLIMSFKKAKGKMKIYNNIKDIVHIVVTNEGKRMAKCAQLNITEPVHFREIGAALERRPELLSQIYPQLGIATYGTFEPGTDYREIQDREVVAGEIATATLYDNIDNLPTPDIADLDTTNSPSLPTEDDEVGANG